MAIKKKNKKADIGGEAVIWIYRFVLLILILIAYMMIVFHYFSEKYDIRQAEAALIGKNVVECISDSNKVILADNFTQDKIEKCIGVNDDSREIYVESEIDYLNSSKIKEIKTGDEDLKPLCLEITEAVSCSNQKYYVLFNENNEIEKTKLKLNIAVRKGDKNV